MRLFNSLKVLAASLVLVSLASAQTGIVTGTVLKPDLTPFAGCDLDFFFLDGNEQGGVSGDFTNASGVFTTTLPSGTYTILIKPPGGVLVQPKVIGPFSIGVFLNVGSTTMLASAGIQGILTNTNNIPLGNSKVRVELAGTGIPVEVTGAGTNPITGAFQFTLPPGAYDVFFDTTGDGTLGAPGQQLNVNCAASVWTNLGTVLLPPGFQLSAVLKKLAGGTPVSDCDVDVRNPNTNEKLYTPHDNSDGSGLVDVVVPAGTWTLDITPDFATGLVAKRITPIVMAADTALGDEFLETGVALSGTVRDSAGNAIAGVDLDVYRYPSNQFVLTSADDTNAMGQYQVMVPADNLTCIFNPIGSATLGIQTHFPQAIVGNTVVDSILPKINSARDSHYGSGHPGTGGLIPTLSTYGTAVIGNVHYGFEIANALPSTVAAVFVAEGPGNLYVPDYDVTFWVDVLTMFSLDGGTFANGVGLFPVNVPVVPAFVGKTFYTQGFVIDPGANFILSHTDAIALVVTD